MAFGTRFLGLGLVGILAATLGACTVSEKEYNALKSENEDLRGRVATSDGQLREKDAQIQTLQTQAAAQPKTADAGGDYPQGGKTAIRQRNTSSGPVVLEVAGDVLFASGQATLKTDAKKELDGIARTLKSKYGGHPIRIEGYTDNDSPKKGKFKSNEALSEARAEAVRDYLGSKGIGNISAVGMGASKPKSSKAASRRVEIVVVDTN